MVRTIPLFIKSVVQTVLYFGDLTTFFFFFLLRIFTYLSFHLMTFLLTWKLFFFCVFQKENTYIIYTVFFQAHWDRIKHIFLRVIINSYAIHSARQKTL